MSGTIAITQDNRWSAAGWLFDWTVGYLAGQLSDPKARESLHEIVELNLGWLGLADFDAQTRAELTQAIRSGLVQEAEANLPDSIPGRAEALELLRQLAATTTG